LQPFLKVVFLKVLPFAFGATFLKVAFDKTFSKSFVFLFLVKLFLKVLFG